MELVYLWVEDYKNIKNQGFNFSPKFNCHYNPETNELTIKENDDYIENFFGENINVTAIIGKNGSGKSSIFKLFIFLVYLKYIDNNLEDNQKIILRSVIKKYKHFFAIFYDSSSNKYMKLTINEVLNNLEISDINKITINFAEEIKEITKKDIKSYTIYFNYMLDSLKDNLLEDWIDALYHTKQDDYEMPILIHPNKDKEIKLYEEEDITKIHIYEMYNKLLKDNNYITSFFNPNKIENINISEDFYYTDKDKVELKLTKKLAKKIKLLQINNCSKQGLIKKDILDYIKSLESSKELKNINKLYILLKILEVNKKNSKILKTIDIDKIKEAIEDFCNNKNLQSVNDINYKELTEKIDKIDDYKIRKIKKALVFNSEKLYNNPQIKKLIDNKKISISENVNILENLPSWIKIDLLDEEKSYTSLSSGEKSLFRLLVELSYHINNLKTKNKYEIINIFLDEAELGFHPQWQKEFIKLLLDTIKQYTKKENELKFNIIFATHSPFLLSDIPKQNIIFLDTDENGNCKVVDGLNEKKETFGANIHTLLSDSFFMEDGLMGEFAKSRIQEIIDFLNDKKKIEDISIEEDQIKQIIESIGEPFLKDKLLSMYYEKFSNEKEKRILKLKKELSRLEDND
jgi:predicted ATPase